MPSVQENAIGKGFIRLYLATITGDVYRQIIPFIGKKGNCEQFMLFFCPNRNVFHPLTKCSRVPQQLGCPVDYIYSKEDYSEK